MSSLVRFVSAPTTFEPEKEDRGLSFKQDFELVAEEMRDRVGRTLHAYKFESFPEKLNPKDLGSIQSPGSDGETRRRINNAIFGVFPKAPTPASLSLEPLQEWEGYVSEVGDEQFTAQLLDITAGGRYEDEVADFPISDLSDTDQELLKLGAIFRWVIGYQRSIGGTKRRVSQITFRRLPAWSKKDIIHAARKAEQIAQSIEWT